MRRRITVSTLAVVVATLLLTGGMTLALASLSARAQTEEEVRQQAEAIGGVLGLAGDAVQDTLPLRTQLDLARERLDVRDVAVVVIQADGTLMDSLGSEMPDPLRLDDLDVERLALGVTVSGSVGDTVFAAVAINPIEPAGGRGARQPGAPAPPLAVVIVTARPDAVLGPAPQWFLVASVVTIGVGVIVAWRLGARLGAPVASASAATRRIAAGDLATRLPEPTDDQDELTELARSINAMAEALQRSRGLEQQFLLSVSHDLRTPLTSIRGYAEAVADGTTTDHARAATVILSEARRLERLVGDLLDLARLDARQFAIDVGRIDAGEACADAAAGFRREGEAAGIDVSADGQPGTVALADPDRLAQVLANLGENALKYATSQLRFEAAPDGPWIEVSVSDDGPGIAEEDRPHVFERLYVTTRQPVRKESGSGLGLAIVRELVTAMGGEVAVREAPGGGTAMVVRLRAADDVG